MTNRWRFVIFIMCLLPVAVPAAPQAYRSPADTSAANLAWSEYAAHMKGMHVALSSIEQSGNSDVDFVRLMLPHHQAAIDMARTQLMYGTDPQMRRLAQEIITDQQSEIELMQLWLQQHRPSSLKADQTTALHAGKEH